MFLNAFIVYFCIVVQQVFYATSTPNHISLVISLYVLMFEIPVDFDGCTSIINLIIETIYKFSYNTDIYAAR